jgi:hypothetical protein
MVSKCKHRFIYRNYMQQTSCHVQYPWIHCNIGLLLTSYLFLNPICKPWYWSELYREHVLLLPQRCPCRYSIISCSCSVTASSYTVYNVNNKTKSFIANNYIIESPIFLFIQTPPIWNSNKHVVHFVTIKLDAYTCRTI